MKKNILYMAALAIMAAACTSEDETMVSSPEKKGDVKMITETVRAFSGDNGTTRVAVDASAKSTWSKNDRVAVHVDDGKYYTTDALATGGSNTADFTVTYPDGSARDAFAVYPASIVAEEATNYGQEGATLDVTLPASYKLAELSDNTTPCPAIATNEAGSDWEFKQLCGLLRLTVESVPANAKRLEIDFNGKKVCGDFSVAAAVTPGTSVIATEDDDANDCVTITKNGEDAVLGATTLVLNIPLPVGAYSGITVTAYDALTDGKVLFTATCPFAYTAARQHGTKRTAYFPSFFRGYDVSTGILKRSKEGEKPATYSLTYGEMSWTNDPETGKVIYSLPEGCNPFEPAVNWNNNDALNKYFNLWRTLRDELGADADNNIDATSDKLPTGWQFPSAGVSQHSTGTDWGNILFAKQKLPITVNGATVSAANGSFAMVAVELGDGNGYSVAAGTYYGLLLLRDGATIPEGYLTNTGYGHPYTDNKLTEQQFNELVKMGCLFISATGNYSETYKWRDLNEWYQCGFYWSITYNSSKDKIYHFEFDEAGNVSVATSSSDRNLYQVVKLVKRVN